MKVWNVQWTRAAEGDLESIIDFIAENHPDRALSKLREIRAAAVRLQEFPERGRVAPELKYHGITQYHEVICSPWRVIYRVAEKTVYVLAVIDSRRNVEDVLLARMVR